MAWLALALKEDPKDQKLSRIKLGVLVAKLPYQHKPSFELITFGQAI